MNKLILYGLTAVFSFMVILIIRAPANFAWQMIRDDIHVPELSIYSVGGTVWNGKTRIGFRDFPVSDLTWNLKPWPLFNGAADMEIDVKGVGHAVHSNVTLHNNTGRLNNLRGILDSEYVNQAGRRLGLQFPGELLLEEFNIVSDGVWFTEMEGLMHWTGGQMLYRDNIGFSSVTLPPLDGKLDLVSGLITLVISHQNLPLLTITLKRDGWATVALKARLFDLVNLPWPNGNNADDTVLIIEENILTFNILESLQSNSIREVDTRPG